MDNKNNEKKVSRLSTYTLYLTIIMFRNLVIFMVCKGILECIGINTTEAFMIIWVLTASSLLFYWGFRAWEKAHSLDSKDIFEVLKEK